MKKLLLFSLILFACMIGTNSSAASVEQVSETSVGDEEIMEEFRFPGSRTFYRDETRSTTPATTR